MAGSLMPQNSNSDFIYPFTNFPFSSSLCFQIWERREAQWVLTQVLMLAESTRVVCLPTAFRIRQRDDFIIICILANNKFYPMSQYFNKPLRSLFVRPVEDYRPDQFPHLGGGCEQINDLPFRFRLGVIDIRVLLLELPPQHLDLYPQVPKITGWILEGFGLEHSLLPSPAQITLCPLPLLPKINYLHNSLLLSLCLVHILALEVMSTHPRQPRLI